MSVEVMPYAGERQEVDSHKRESGSDAMPDRAVGSVNVVSYSGRRRETDEVEPWGTSIAEDLVSFRIRPARFGAQPSLRERSEKVLRRINGFLLEDEGEEYKVVFIEDKVPVQYYMPSSPLRKAGITAPNQPFQMDEIEIEISGGRVLTGYTFSPLAKSSDAFNDAIELNDERSGKLNAIFNRFGKAKN